MQDELLWLGFFAAGVFLLFVWLTRTAPANVSPGAQVVEPEIVSSMNSTGTETRDEGGRVKKRKALAKPSPGSVASNAGALSKHSRLLPTVERRDTAGRVVSGWYRDTMEVLGFRSQTDDVQAIGELAAAAAKTVDAVTQYNIAETVGKKKVRVASLDADIEIAEKQKRLNELKNPAIEKPAPPTEDELREQARKELEQDKAQKADRIRVLTEEVDRLIQNGDRTTADLRRAELNTEQDSYRDICERLANWRR